VGQVDRPGVREGPLNPGRRCGPNIPDAFDVYTLVLLRRPTDASEMPGDELDALRARHLAYRAQLRRDGVLVANGPLREQSDETLRGLSILRAISTWRGA